MAGTRPAAAAPSAKRQRPPPEAAAVVVPALADVFREAMNGAVAVVEAALDADTL